MMGAPGDEGLTPRLCQNMFDQITEIQEKGGNGYKIAIETSYYEIYNEKVFDLLASECVCSTGAGPCAGLAPPVATMSVPHKSDRPSPRFPVLGVDHRQLRSMSANRRA